MKSELRDLYTNKTPQTKKGGFNAGRRTKFAPVKSLDSSELSSEFSDFETLSSNIKVNLVISSNGHNSFYRI